MKLPRYRPRTLTLLMVYAAITVYLFSGPSTVDDGGDPRPDMDFAVGVVRWIGTTAIACVIWLLCRWFASTEKRTSPASTTTEVETLERSKIPAVVDKTLDMIEFALARGGTPVFRGD